MKLPPRFTGPTSLRSSVPILSLAAEMAQPSFLALLSETGPSQEGEIPAQVDVCDAPSSTRAQGCAGTSSKIEASSPHAHLAKLLPATRWQP